MSRHGTRRLRVGLVGLIGLVCACARGDLYDSIPREEAAQVWAREACALVEACACSPERVSVLLVGGYDECEDALTDRYERKLEPAGGMTFDPECMAARVNLLTQRLACSTAQSVALEDWAEYGSPRRCKLYAGAGQAGEPCQEHPRGLGDTCAPAAVCLNEVCVTQRDAAEPCDPASDLCHGNMTCRTAFYDPDVTRCRALPGAGEPCDGTRCAERLNCLDGVCGEPPGEGEPCELANSSETPHPCAAGLYCASWDAPAACQLVRPAGDPCEHDMECGPHSHCDGAPGEAQTCVALEPLVCFE